MLRKTNSASSKPRSATQTTRHVSHETHSDNTCPNCHHPLPMMKEFVFRTKQTLIPKGFYPHVNTFVCVGLCRDEITSPFEEEVEAMWGQAFICGSLGGMLFCGKTGFAAAHHHAPETARIVYYCFTHIAIDNLGMIGTVYRTRSGMNEKTTACGALAAFTSEIASNKLNLHFDEEDIEMSMLKKHIVKATGLSTDSTNAPDLLAVTMAAYETITIDLERHARHDAEKFKERQYALFTGVQVHGPDGSDYCWLGKASLIINGVQSPLTLITNTVSSSRPGTATGGH
ncbi:unnamed protein product [Rotaria magnacalcarata]